MLNITHLKDNSFHQHLESLIKILGSLIWILLNLLQFCNILRFKFWFSKLFNMSFPYFNQGLRWSSHRNLYRLHEPIHCTTPKSCCQLSLLDFIIHSLSYIPYYLTKEPIFLWILNPIPMEQM